MTQTVQAKSNQLNAIDLAEPKTITITRMQVDPSSNDQPVTVHYEGENGKPFKPSKTVRRIMVALWGAHSEDYLGKSMTLYNDPSVIWAGKEVGGIRVSHMSDIKDEQVLTLLVSKARWTSYVIQPLRQQAAANGSKPDQEPAGKYYINARKTDDLAKWRDAFVGMAGKAFPAAAKGLEERHADLLRDLIMNGSDEERDAALAVEAALKAKIAETEEPEPAQ